MLALLGQVVRVSHYGFLGIDGLVGIFIGLLIFAVVVAILFKLFNLVMAAVGVPSNWAQILYWLAVLLIFLCFLHWFGIY